MTSKQRMGNFLWSPSSSSDLEALAGLLLAEEDRAASSTVDANSMTYQTGCDGLPPGKHEGKSL